jgi:hypothetical protein
VRYVVISTTAALRTLGLINGVRELELLGLSMAPHRAAMFTTKHLRLAKSLEINKSRAVARRGLGCSLVSPALAAGLPLAVAEQQLRGAFFFERKFCLLVTCCDAADTHAQKNRTQERVSWT